MSQDDDPKTTGSSRATSPKRKAWRGAVHALRSKAFREELVVVLSLCSVALLVRWLRLMPIDYYEDTINKWHFVRQWFYNNDFSNAAWTHHMARFGINGLVFVAQLLFGRSPWVYYVAPVAAFFLQILVLYFLGKRLGGRAVGVVAVLLRTVFTGMDQGSVQLLPDGFGGTAMILACYFLVRYQEADDGRRMRWLTGAGLAMAWAYLIKESNVLFGPGVLLAAWIAKRRFRDLLLLGAIPALTVAIETVAFSVFTKYSTRLSIVEESHGEATVTFIELFDRFTKLGPAWQMMFWVWVPSALWLLASQDKRIRMVLVMPATFLFLLTFLVRGVDPIRLWARFQSRYFDAVGPLLMVGVALFAVEIARRIWSARAPDSWRVRVASSPRLAMLATPLACLMVAIPSCVRAYGAWSEHPSQQIPMMVGIVNDAYRRNLPIVEKRTKEKDTLEERRVRPLKAIYAVYLNDKYLAKSSIAKKGHLPDILEAVRDSTVSAHSYLLKDHSVYQPGDVENLIERGCAVVVYEYEKTTALERSRRLPAGCKPPRDKAPAP